MYQLFLCQPPALSDALYLATRGSAQLLGKEGELGLLEGGALADILLVDMQGGWNSFPLFRIDKTGYHRSREHAVVWARVARGPGAQVCLSLRRPEH